MLHDLKLCLMNFSLFPVNHGLPVHDTVDVAFTEQLFLPLVALRSQVERDICSEQGVIRG